MATLDGAFRNVLSRFKCGLTQDEVEDFRFSTIEDIHNVIGDLQAEQGRKKKMMNLSRIQSFLEAMEQYGRVIEVFLNTTEFLAFIWVRNVTLDHSRSPLSLILVDLGSH